MNGFLGGSVASVLVRLLVVSFVVGMLLTMFGFDPETLYFRLEAMVRHLIAYGLEDFQHVGRILLTGAMIVSLGHEYGGMFSNDDGLAAQLSAAGAASGDPLWRMSLGPAYDKLIDSPIADIKNIGPPGQGGSITAAQFLKRFIHDGVKWAHLDIAGMVWAAKPGAVWDKGATGFGVRLLNQFVADNFEG